MFDQSGNFESTKHLNAMIFIAKQYGMEIDWDKSSIDGTYLSFKHDVGDVDGFAQALNRMFQEQWG